ncbi:MAG: response regulator [Nitrospira sp.]|nr:response regulator [Nitrospira sp.]MBX3347197.1 response regulator [Nitrospira sp.]
MATILLVDDESDIRESIRDMLEADGHRVVEATDGQEALQGWRAHQPDLLITDFWMPRMNGLDVIESVAAEQPALPIILMSGGMEDHLRRSVLQHFPSVRYLPKPFANSQLREYVRDASQ